MTNQPDPVPLPSGQEFVPLKVLAVDDEAPALADLVFELRTFASIASVSEASDSNAALRALRGAAFDAVFLDIRMPGLNGVELARVLQQFKSPPALVFVTAHDAHAVEAFEVQALDYVLKPVRRERLELAIERVLATRAVQLGQTAVGQLSVPAISSPADSASVSARIDQPGAPPVHAPIPASAHDDEKTIAVESAGRIRFIDRRDVQYVSASGDYVRLHLRDSNFLFRAALSALEERWSAFGFVRIHRSYLVALPHIDEVRIEPGRGYVIVIGETILPVSRRSAPNLRARLYTHASELRRP
jgi:DNA-binding LytR/AlgR family response regulator